MQLFEQPNEAILEVDPLEEGPALELHVTETGGVPHAAWLTETGAVLRWWRPAEA